MVSCVSNKTSSSETDSESQEITSLNTQKGALTGLEKEDSVRAKINALYAKNASKCSQKVSAVTNFNDKQEFWRICDTGNGRIIHIQSHDATNLYEEVYFEQEGELIYAEESIQYMPINHYQMGIWNCKFYTEKGKLITIMSLGHGKTENDAWEPEIIFEMYKKRIAELNNIEKE